MTSLHDPLQLPCGQVLPNRIMKAAMSEALADSGNSPGARLERLYRTWSRGGYGLLITGNVLFRLNDEGLHFKPSPLVGISAA